MSSMAWIKFLLVMIATIASSNALQITNFTLISGPFNDVWMANNPDNVRADGSESFGLAYANGKIYVISRRGANPSAVGGGIVSILDRKAGTWTHKPYDALATDASFVDHLLTLGDRLFLLVSSSTDAIRFHKLFVFDDEQGQWIEVTKFDIDPLSSEPLVRSKEKFISINVPDQEGNVAYIGATDHDTGPSNSSTTLSKLLVNFDAAKKPLDASLKRIIHLDLPMTSAIIATAAKEDKLFVMVTRFTDGPYSTVSLDKVVDLKSGVVLSLDPVVPMISAIDYTQERIFQLKDRVLFLGVHQLVGDVYKRYITSLNFNGMTVEEAYAFFPVVPNRVHAFDQKNMEVFVAGLKLGVFAATIM